MGRSSGWERAPTSTRNVVPGFALRLKRLREARDWTLTDLARASGTHITALSKIELGQRQPSLELAQRLARALEVELTDLAPRDWPLTRDRRKLLAALAPVTPLDTTVPPSP